MHISLYLEMHNKVVKLRFVGFHPFNFNKNLFIVYLVLLFDLYKTEPLQNHF
jgi:hypothetical protein